MIGRTSFLRLTRKCRVLVTVLLWLPAILQAEKSDDITLEIMSYNVQHMGYPAFLSHHFEKQRLKALVQRVSEMRSLPDVIVFQEVFLPSAHQKIVSGLAKLYPFYTEIGGEHCNTQVWDYPPVNCEPGLRKRFTHNSGVFILSRWPIEERASLSFDKVRVSYTFDFMAQKGAVYARINKAGRHIHVVGTHLQADGPSHDIRMKQVAELRSWLSGLSLPREYPLFFAGDFNVSNTRVREFEDLLNTIAGQVHFCHPLSNSVSPDRNDYLTLIYGDSEEKTLDFVLMARDFVQAMPEQCLKALDFKAREPWRGFSILSGKVKMKDISDHFPVTVRYRLSAP